MRILQIKEIVNAAVIRSPDPRLKYWLAYLSVQSPLLFSISLSAMLFPCLENKKWLGLSAEVALVPGPLPGPP